MARVTLEEAELVRDKLMMELHDERDVTGVGIVRLGNGYGVRVNLKTSVLEGTLPTKIAGVPIKTRVTGRIVAHQRG